MHLFAAKPGAAVDEGEGIVDLAQTPASLAILSAADSVLSLLAMVGDTLPEDYPSLRLVNTLTLARPAAFDLWQDRVLDRTTPALPNGTRAVVVSLLGGISYWRYGLEALQRWAAQRQATLIAVPGEESEDDEILTAGTVAREEAHRVWRYLREGGEQNARALLEYLHYRWLCPDAARASAIPLPTPMPVAFIHDICAPRCAAAPPTLALVIYKSHVQSADTAAFSSLAALLARHGFRVVTIAVTSLKDPRCLALLERTLAAERAVLVINTTGFAIARAANEALTSRPTRPAWPLHHAVPVLQATFASTTEEDWEAMALGLCTRDIAMQVALPELDGRIITRAIGFKAALHRHERAQYDSVRFVLHEERASFVAQLAQRWHRLQVIPAHEKRVTIVLANYPADDASLGSGIGLDTPASTAALVQALKEAGYHIEHAPASGEALMQRLRAGVTNQAESLYRPAQHAILLAHYQQHLAQLPTQSYEALLSRWGPPERDPRLVMTAEGLAFPIAGIALGRLFIGIQPTRGHFVDQAEMYHDADLVPPHAYLAFYFWMRFHWCSDAVVHMGTHGNLEWLPGKSMALSSSCWPDIVLGPLPNLYPFIVNDPGEAAQAKRRTQAVLIGHLTPPMMQADIYGHLAALEQLMDEYYQAVNVDARRERRLRQQILKYARDTHVLDELASARALPNDDDERLLIALDAWLCEIKESQVRSGLHILGQLPVGSALVDQLLSLLRIPRTRTDQGNAMQQEDQGVLHALAHDLALPDGFDPLARTAEPWHGLRPVRLMALSKQRWRTEADTRERLDALARQLIERHVVHAQPIDDALPATARVLALARDELLTALQDSVRREHASLLKALNGQPVPPGASGSPARGRWDILPTGRNLHTLDSRAIPTPTAWALGQQAATLLIERYLQEHGDFPRWIGMALWGTATLRTGGDDVAQALALIGVRPVWAPGSSRIADIDVIPAFQLGRPRVDVTLRLSGFFRDAFPNLIHLLNKAFKALAVYEEPGRDNTIRHHIQERKQALTAQGLSPTEAHRHACQRLFGSAEGLYGSGLNRLLESGNWQDQAAMTDAYVRWGGHAWYTNEQDNLAQRPAAEDFADQLRKLDAVLHNRDVIEQDLLDASDHAQFQGGMANAVQALKGVQPALYVGDHTQPGAQRVQRLSEAITQTLHARVLNPRWQHAMRQHGYKGASELARAVDSLVAYGATTRLIADHQYAQVGASLLAPENRQFMEAHAPAALQRLVSQLLNAIRQGLWQAPDAWSHYLKAQLLHLEQTQEEP